MTATPATVEPTIIAVRLLDSGIGVFVGSYKDGGVSGILVLL